MDEERFTIKQRRFGGPWKLSKFTWTREEANAEVKKLSEKFADKGHEYQVVEIKRGTEDRFV